MPFEVGKAAIDFLIKHSANRHNLELDFFGGEPLMNLDVVKKLSSMQDRSRKSTTELPIHNDHKRYSARR